MRKSMVVAALLAFGLGGPVYADTSEAVKAGVDRAAEKAKPPAKRGADAGWIQVAETRIDITRGNAIRRGWFGEAQPIAVSDSGVEYTAPGSRLESGRGVKGPFGGHLGRTLCPDGQPVRYLYNWPGGPDCSTDRPQ